MDLSNLFLIYVTLFRLAIIGVGALSITLGYRLFYLVSRSRQNKPPDEIKATMGRNSIAARNLAPGTAFALFGTILIVAVFVQGNPQLTLETLQRVAEPGFHETSSKLTLRGPAETLSSLIERGSEMERSSNTAEAMKYYEQSLAILTVPANELATHYADTNQVEDAIALAKLAATLNPRNAAVLDTLAQALQKHGDRAEASNWMSKAAKIDPSLAIKAQHYKENLR